MRTIPQAMTWEVGVRGLWLLAATTLTAIAVPTGLFGVVTLFAGPPSEILSRPGELAGLHLGLMLYNALIVATLLAALHWDLRPLYPWPATTATLVLWRLAPIAVLAGLETLLWTGATNATFHLGWPYAGPALMTATAASAILALIWLFQYSAWSAGGLGAFLAAAGWWIDGRYPRRAENIVGGWLTLTGGETLTLAAVALAAYLTALIGVARNRRGEAPISVGFWEWAQAKWSGLNRREVRWPTALAALRWQWRPRTLAAPAVVLTAWAVGAGCWAFLVPRTESLVEATRIAGSFLMATGGLSGLLLAATGESKRSSFRMGSFLATRPTTSGALGRMILRATLASVVAAWGAWLAAVVLSTIVEGVRDSDLPRLTLTGLLVGMQGELPALIALLASWIAATIIGALALMHRPRLVAGAVWSCIGLYVASATLGLFMSTAAHDALGIALTEAISAAIVLAIGGAYVAAQRRDLVSRRAALVASGVWLATMAAAIAWAVSAFEVVQLLPFCLLAAVVALAVAPWATYPLAVSLNRTR